MRVTNDSSVEWNAATHGSLRAGNHWLGADAAMLVQDDGRAALPSLLPGQACVATLGVSAAPAAAAWLELDVVHEGIVWFADKGSQTLRLPLGHHEPTRATSLSAEPPAYVGVAGVKDDEVVEFPMHGVPREEVEALIREGGAGLVLSEPDARGGPEWEGFRYFVRVNRSSE